MSRLSKYVKEKIVKVLVAALVVGTVAGNEGIAAQAADVLGTASLSNPYSFAVYANEYTKPNHVEGNVAVGTLKAHVDTWRYCSYVGDFADNNASMTMNIDDAALVYPAYNSDGSRNELTEQIGQGYKFSIYEKDSDTRRRYFITDNKLVAYDVQDNIKENIAAKIVEMQGVSAGYYGRADVDNDTELVLNLTAGDVESHLKQIFLAADAGKKVLVNILDCGNVTLAHQDDNYTSVRHEHADWAANIIWNFGNASYVETGRVFGYILAPNATVHNGNNVIGGIICNVLEQVGEVHMPDPWTPRTTPTPNVTPTPTPVVTEEPTPTPVVTEEPTPTPVVTEEPTPTPVVTEEPTPTPVVTEEPTPTPVVTEEPTPTPIVTEEPTPTPVVTEEPTPTPVVTEEPTPTPVVTEEPTPTPVVTEEPTPTPVVTEEPTPTPVVTEEPTPTPVVTEEPTPTPVVTEEPTPTPVVTEEPTPTPIVTEEPTPTPVVTEEPTPTPVVTEEPTPTPVVTEEPTPTPVVTEEPTPTPVVTEEPTPTPVVTEEPTPTPVVTEEPTPTPDDPGTPDNPTDPGTPEDPVTPETPQVLGARRRRMVTIEDDPTPLADRAVLGASRRPQTGDASNAWNLGFALSLTGLGAWLILKKKQ